MKKDSELDWAALERSWHSQSEVAPVPDALLRRVRRQERRLWLGAAGDWLAAAVMGAFAVYLIAYRFSAANLFWALVFLALVGWALVFSVNNRRDTWLPASESARAYLDLALLRVQRRRRALKFMWILFAAELGIFALWELLALSGWLPWFFFSLSVRAFSILGVVLAIMVVWSWLVSLRIGREFRELERLRGEIENSV
ncbi:hypothetical protein [Microbulbifer sp.]|uniref:hypothetical protein n=1 Tax=Microbulbifer sp. TaxID=1908541 RepID=UPI003F327529